MLRTRCALRLRRGFNTGFDPKAKYRILHFDRNATLSGTGESTLSCDCLGDFSLPPLLGVANDVR